MRLISFILLLLFSMNNNIYSQQQSMPKQYSHKIVVEEILQAKNYTYLQVKERIKDHDSLQWLALPAFEPKTGDVYYYENGLQMGEFQSKELDRKFSHILFLGTLSKSPDIAEKNLTHAPQEETVQQNVSTAPLHKVLVKEVKQAGSYTYIRVKENGKDEWIAVTKINALPGQTYTYTDAALMKDFPSKELNKTFKEVLFIGKLKLCADCDNKKTPTSEIKKAADENIANKNKNKKKELKIETAEGGISIAKLFENKNNYSGKIVKIKGEVTKFSPEIMNKNWIHIQDGTEFSGKFDLTVTTATTAKPGDIIIVEGKIILDKDFGSGYFFDVMMEDAVALQK